MTIRKKMIYSTSFLSIELVCDYLHINIPKKINLTSVKG